jgi:hypothetical protein
MALDADRKNGPAARSFAADAHDCIMVRIQRAYRIQVCGVKMRRNGELPSHPQQTRQPCTQQKPKLCKSSSPSSSSLPVCSGVKTCPDEGRGRCETQATLGGKAAKLCYRFGPLTPSARSANLIAGDGMKNGFPAPNKELAINQKQLLDRKSPIQVGIRFPPASGENLSRTRIRLPSSRSRGCPRVFGPFDQRAITEEMLVRQQLLYARWLSTAAMNLLAISPSPRRSRFFVNTVTSQIGPSIPNLTNQRTASCNPAAPSVARSDRDGEAAVGAVAASVLLGALHGRSSLAHRATLVAVVTAAWVTAYLVQVVVPAKETSLAPIAGIAPSYGPKTVSAQCGGDHLAHLAQHCHPGRGSLCRLRPYRELPLLRPETELIRFRDRACPSPRDRRLRTRCPRQSVRTARSGSRSAGS